MAFLPNNLGVMLSGSKSEGVDIETLSYYIILEVDLQGGGVCDMIKA